MVQLRFQSSILTLPDPELGNTFTLGLRFRRMRAMDNSFWSYKATPARRILSLSFRNMNRNKIKSVETFLLTAAGQYVDYTDHHGQAWRGKVVTTPNEFTHEGRKNNVFTLEMEVIK